MAPSEFFDGTGQSFDMGEDHGDTRLSRRNYRILLTFIAKVLHNMPGRSFVYHDDAYPDVDGSMEDFKDSTNIMWVRPGYI